MKTRRDLLLTLALLAILSVGSESRVVEAGGAIAVGATFPADGARRNVSLELTNKLLEEDEENEGGADSERFPYHRASDAPTDPAGTARQGSAKREAGSPQ